MKILAAALLATGFAVAASAVDKGSAANGCPDQSAVSPAALARTTRTETAWSAIEKRLRSSPCPPAPPRPTTDRGSVSSSLKPIAADTRSRVDNTPNVADTSGPVGQKPVWEVATVPPDAMQVAKSTYVVRAGDTLLAVVRRTGAGADVIAHDNDLKPPFQLRPGQKLKIREGRYHTVRKGQSGIAIARAYQVPWQRIVELNHLQEPFTLREGQRLLLPPAQDVAKMSLEERAAAFKIDLTDLAIGSEPALASNAKPAAPTSSPARRLAPTTPVAQPSVAFEGGFAWPVRGPIIRNYGPMGNGGRNDGITIAAPQGAPIAAAADGVVMWVGQHPAFGNVALVRHGDGWITIYGNADSLRVKRGQSVKKGQTIGFVGATGARAEGPQTFFEILKGKKPVNPLPLLPKLSDIRANDREIEQVPGDTSD